MYSWTPHRCKISSQWQCTIGLCNQKRHHILPGENHEVMCDIPEYLPLLSTTQTRFSILYSIITCHLNYWFSQEFKGTPNRRQFLCQGKGPWLHWSPQGQDAFDSVQTLASCLYNNKQQQRGHYHLLCQVWKQQQKIMYKRGKKRRLLILKM